MPFMRRSFRRAYFRPVWHWQAYANRHQRRHAGPRIGISISSVLEDASIGVLVGSLSVTGGSGTYAFTITDDAGGLFALDGMDDTRLEVASFLDYETATLHTIEITADNGVDDPLVREFPVYVLNVLEVTLGALTLDGNAVVEATAPGAIVGAVQGKSTGSTLSMFNTAGNRFALSGTNVVTGSVATDFSVSSAHNITLRETHADGSNSPRDTVIEITVSEISEPGEFAATFYYLGF